MAFILMKAADHLANPRRRPTSFGRPTGSRRGPVSPPWNSANACWSAVSVLRTATTTCPRCPSFSIKMRTPRPWVEIPVNLDVRILQDKAYKHLPVLKLRLQLINPSTLFNELNTTLTPHSITQGLGPMRGDGPHQPERSGAMCALCFVQPTGQLTCVTSRRSGRSAGSCCCRCPCRCHWKQRATSLLVRSVLHQHINDTG